jgi:hypothetical protein
LESGGVHIGGLRTEGRRQTLVSHKKRSIMELKQRLNRIAGVLALASIAAPAHSDPVGSAAGFIKSTSIVTASTLEQVAAYRVCTAQGRVRRCRSVDIYGPGVYGYRAPYVLYRYGPIGDYIPSDPIDYRLGTRRWWSAMDRLDRGGGTNGGP